jgi:hypothetical protein
MDKPTDLNVALVAKTYFLTYLCGNYGVPSSYVSPLISLFLIVKLIFARFSYFSSTEQSLSIYLPSSLSTYSTLP